MLEGKNVRLRLRDKEDLDFFSSFWNNVDYSSEYESIQPQISRAEAEKRIETQDQSATGVQWTWFVIEKKDGSKIGFIIHFIVQPSGFVEVGYALTPSEMGRGYGTEALEIMVDYLFLTRDIARIQATTDVRNIPSQRILEKTGFKREGTIRKAGFVRGRWQDDYLYSILREEWIKPRILTTSSKTNERRTGAH